MSMEKIDMLPKHIGFIMDGNGRWAQKRGIPREMGHKAGADAFRKVVKACKELKIPYVSFFAFSTENWSRPQNEIDSIMNLFREYMDEVRKHADEEVRIIFLGDKSVFDEDIQRKMISLEQDSKNFTKMTLLLAINYGGRADIVYGIKQIVQLAQAGVLQSEDVNENMFSDYLYTKGIPDVDLLIRPSGEMRLSNFLIWQSVYAEFYFTDVLWPDFSKKNLELALEDYYSRNRRFGGV